MLLFRHIRPVVLAALAVTSLSDVALAAKNCAGVSDEVGNIALPWRREPQTKGRRFYAFESPAAVTQAIASEFVAAAREAITKRDRFVVVLTGGSTPRALYELLASPQYRYRIQWKKVHVFVSDERFVPPGDPLHNFSMIARSLLKKVPIPDKNVHAINTRAASKEAAALSYAAELRRELGSTPVFDLVLAGMGADGHTASLFPSLLGTEQAASSAFALPVEAPTHIEPHVPRVSMSVQLLRRARATFFLATGAEKAPVVNAIRTDARAAERFPAALFDGEGGMGPVTWLLDRSAYGETP